MQFFTKKHRGFTLIELLVVIAIIGILASIVLVSLSSARNKAKDARIQADVAQIRILSEMIYSENSAYWFDATHGICLAGASAVSTLNVNDTTSGAEITTINDDINTQNGSAGPVAVCITDGTNYCVSAITASGANICVGDAGKTGSVVCAAADTCN